MSVSFTLSQPGGCSARMSMATESTGKALWSDEASRKDPLGVYSVAGTAAYKSQTAASTTISFTVQ